MALKPLEFSDCYLDSPYFRDSVYEHEKELESTDERIKGLIKECKNLLRAFDSLSKAQRSFCNVLKDFKLNNIGEIDRTDKDEIEIADAFEDFAELIEKAEEERERMLIKPLEKFQKEQIGAAKADKQAEDDFKKFQKLAFVYVSKLQEVNGTKKFELIEILLGYIYGQKSFYHNGHECYTDAKYYLDRLSLKLQNIRERYKITQEETEDLKKRVEKQGETGELQKTTYATRQGYLFMQEKKHGGLVFSWTKHYCMYQKENKILTMIPYSQTMGKMSSDTNTFIVSSCTRKPTEPLERRFCFQITGSDRKDIMTLQALSDEDHRCWLEVMDGHEPVRKRYEITQEETEDLKKRVEKQGETGELQKTTYARQGYLFMQEKKHGRLVFPWTKHYCMYQKENKMLTMIPYSQTMGKMSSDSNTFIVSSCTRKPTEPLERRFCFQITGSDRKDIMTLEALSDEDRRCWLEVMDGNEPIYMASADLLKDAPILSQTEAPVNQKSPYSPKQGQNPKMSKPDPPPKKSDPPPEKKVRAIYNCVGENSSELSFSVGAIITNVEKSTEEGWLTGTLDNGRTGLLPENYVVPIEQPY
eukprot:gene7582-8421_t